MLWVHAVVMEKITFIIIIATIIIITTIIVRIEIIDTNTYERQQRTFIFLV